MARKARISNLSLLLATTFVGACLAIEVRADEFDAFMAEKTPIVDGPAVTVAPEDYPEELRPEPTPAAAVTKSKKKTSSAKKAPAIKENPAPKPKPTEIEREDFPNSNAKSQQRYQALPEEDPVVIDSGVPYYFE